MCDEHDAPIATRGHWKTVEPTDLFPIPAPERRFTAEEYGRIRRGVIPEAMEDKWFVFLEDGWLYLHRSWTGYLIFQCHFELTDQGDYRIDAAFAARDPFAVSEKMAEYDRDVLLMHIRMRLLGEPISSEEFRQIWNPWIWQSEE